MFDGLSFDFEEAFEFAVKRVFTPQPPWPCTIYLIVLVLKVKVLHDIDLLDSNEASHRSKHLLIYFNY